MVDAHPDLGSRTEQGCLLLADVSGYTAYLQSSEIDHAQDVLADLTETVVRALVPPLTLSEIEGDAVFGYLVGERIDPSVLLDSVEACYFAFRRRVDAIVRATSCQCNACVLIPQLDLKFVAHHGVFGRNRIAGREKPTGTDVIVVHRLLKSRVADRLGHRGYAFFTDALVAAMGLDPSAVGFVAHAEQADEVGEVRGWIEDLHIRWREEQERRRVWVAPDQASFVHETDTPAPRQLVWTYLTDPVLRRGWQPDTKSIDEANPSGRRGAGTKNHCVHGADAVLEEIVDWRPFDYLTMDMDIPIPGISSLRATFELSDLPSGGTRVTQRVARMASISERLIWRVAQPRYRRVMEANGRGLVAALEQALAEPASLLEVN